MQATNLTAQELIARINKQVAYYVPLFQATNPQTATGTQAVAHRLREIATDLEAGNISPVVAQVRIVAARRVAARYEVSFDLSTR